jgi:hypothetical protein
LVKAAIIAMFILLVALFWLPEIEGVRENRIGVFFVAIIAFCALITISKGTMVSILMIYVACHMYLITSTMAAFLTLGIYAGMSAVYAAMVITSEEWVSHRKHIYNAVCVIALINVYVEWLQLWGISVNSAPTDYFGTRMFGLTGNPNEVSALLAISLPFFFRKRWVWCIPAIVGGLVMARTTNGLLASLIVTGVYLAYRYKDNWREMAIGMIFLILAGGLYITSIDTLDIKGQMQGRGVIYKKTVELTNIHPTGWGLGQYQHTVPLLTFSKGISEIEGMAHYVQLSRKDLFKKAMVILSGTSDDSKIKENLDKQSVTAAFVQAHNEPLEFLFIFGYPGFILLILAIISVLIKGFRATDKLPVLCFCASFCTALLFFSWQIIPMAIITVVSVALIVSKETPIIDFSSRRIYG